MLILTERRLRMGEVEQKYFRNNTEIQDIDVGTLFKLFYLKGRAYLIIRDADDDRMLPYLEHKELFDEVEMPF